jgi:hypothetical protein
MTDLTTAAAIGVGFQVGRLVPAFAAVGRVMTINRGVQTA